MIPGSNNRDVLVPTFLVPATQIALDKEKVKAVMEIDKATGGVSNIKSFLALILTKYDISCGTQQILRLWKLERLRYKSLLIQ